MSATVSEELAANPTQQWTVPIATVAGELAGIANDGEGVGDE